ncbi:MAG: hypothetical protein JSS50_03750 [Proteobacteria bacterium]|nr:hypothetical protein [Pseudomonadota bacterium]
MQAGVCVDLKGWLIKKDSFTGSSMYIGGTVLMGVALPVCISIAVEGGQIAHLQGGWVFLVSTATVIGFVNLHKAISRLDGDDALSHNGLREYLSQKNIPYEVNKAKTATTAMVVECWALGAMAATTMSSCGADILASMMVLGGVPLLTYILAGQALQKWNYEHLVDKLPSMACYGKGAA